MMKERGLRFDCQHLAGAAVLLTGPPGENKYKNDVVVSHWILCEPLMREINVVYHNEHHMNG